MNVLVATDGSDHSMKAVKRALEMAERENANVTLIAVAFYAKENLDEMPLDVQDKLEAQAAAALKKAKAVFDEKGVKVQAVLEAGVVPANNIIEKAEREKFDHILLGSTGTTGLTRAILGSTAAKVVAYAPCCVTVVK
jgi:nucleotide-binding universal stress UspA family protein